MINVARVSCIGLALAGFSGTVRGADHVPSAKPIYSTGVPNPTQDKPQSKLWFAQGRWWAWLPVANGSTILERTPAGWREVTELRTFLSGLPGQGDVWADGEVARAVLVGNDRLAVVELRYDRDKATYVPGPLHHQFELSEMVAPKEQLETATIARDSTGRWWIACDRGQSVLAFSTTDDAGLVWGDAIVLASGIAADDISAIFALKDRIGVIWSDQNADAVLFREHLDKLPSSDWMAPVSVELGNKTADDHFNGVIAADGTLFVATKNSVDRVGAPQHVLRVRSPDGAWRNYPYAVLHENLSPTRPIALLAESTQRLYLLHTIHERTSTGERDSYIVAIETDPLKLDLDQGEKRVLSAALPINNVTGPKGAYPVGAPQLILASDGDGNVYEGRLDE
jgi:hypothetical protein